MAVEHETSNVAIRRRLTEPLYGFGSVQVVRRQISNLEKKGYNTVVADADHSIGSETEKVAGKDLLMHRKPFFSIGLIVFTMLLAGRVVAQRPPLRSPPQQFGRPPIYDLFQQRQGILPNFYQYYLPQRRLQQNLRMQEYQLQRQGTAIEAMQNQWLAPDQTGTGVSPTGRGSTFMNYSHFYPGLSTPRR